MSVSGLQCFCNCAERSVQYWSLLADPSRCQIGIRPAYS
ncbi:hypothetical protein D8I24_6264 [Cupriavidus necator H850]|nr:hypothetical protein D8I24_6264 [Cupriavidus necator H850]